MIIFNDMTNLSTLLPLLFSWIYSPADPYVNGFIIGIMVIFISIIVIWQVAQRKK